MGIWDLVLLLSIILVIVLAYRQVETGNIGIVFRFGKLRRVLQPGFNTVIPIIDRVEYHSTQAHQQELPDDPERIDRVNDLPAAGMKHPYRILQRGMREAVFYERKAAGDPTIVAGNSLTQWKQVLFAKLSNARKKGLEVDSLHFPLTSEVAVMVEWHLDGTNFESIENFIQNVSPERGISREEEVRKRIDDMISGALQELLGPVTLGHARDMTETFSLHLKEKVEVLVGEKPDPSTNETNKPWGIHVRDLRIKSIHPGETINKARAAAAAAASTAQGAIRTAEAEAQSTRVKAEAAAFAEEQKGKGEAARIGEMAKAMRDPNARFIATLDVAEQVLPHAKPIIIQGPDGIGGMGKVVAGVLALGQQDLGDTKQPDTPTK